MLQNATHLRKSAPWPPNISDEHVFCTAPATQNASFKILFKGPTPAIVFRNATKPSRFAHFWQGAQSFAPATRKHIWAILNVQKCSEPIIFFALLTSTCASQLRATTACTFSTSHLPKVVWTWCALYILTSKCASRHNGVHFFNIATSKSGPDMVCLVHFDFEMCFAPQRVHFFDIATSKSGPDLVCFVYILTSKCASRHNGVHFFEISTSKSGPELVCFVHFDFEMCFAPQRRAIFHLSSS